MRGAALVLHARLDEAFLVGLTGLLLIAGLTIGGQSPLAYFVVAVPIVVGVSWWRPVYGFALLLGLVFLTEEFEIDTLAGNIEPFLLNALPLLRNLKAYSPLTSVPVNAFEIWLILLVVIWLVQGVLTNRPLRLAPPPCMAAWMLAAATIGFTFFLGITSGGDVQVALWEVRALGYLFGVAWVVPQLVERRRDVEIILVVVTLAFGLKAVQGLYRYFVVLGMELDLSQTFMAHEDPVMFVPLFYLLVMLVHYRAAPGLRRVLLVSAPLMLSALVLTQRRVAYITLGLCAVFLAVALSGSARRMLLRVMVAFLVMGVAYTLAFAGSTSPWGRPIERAVSLFDPVNLSNLYRMLELENLRYTIQLHPWGIGFGHPYEIIQTLPRLKMWPYEYIAHNQVLWIWTKAGTVGFVLVMFFFARVVAESTWTHRRLQDPLFRAVAVVIGLAVVNQLVASYFELQLTYCRNMIYLGTFIGLLGPLQEWGGLARRPGWRWRL
jgi:O-antigen ligase